MTTTLIRGSAGAGKWQEGLCVVELPHGASTIAANAWRWPLKSEERDNRATFGLIHQGVVVTTIHLHLWRGYRDAVTVLRGRCNEPRRLFQPV